MRALILGLALISTTAWADPPAVADGFVFSPRFVTEAGAHQAGTAFALKVDDKVLVVTAMHLFGPAGGMEVQLTGEQIATQITGVKVTDIFSGVAVGDAHKALALADTHPMGDDAIGDIAAFEAKLLTGLDKLNAKGPGFHPGTLAAEAPKKGDIVYVVAPFLNDKANKTQEAKVADIDDNWLFFEYVNADLDLAGTSGAPVVNAAGEIVGINLGGGKMKDGKLIGSANPLPAVKKKLTDALGAK